MFDQPAILKFLSKLKGNNSKVWFDANRDEYQAVRTEWLKFTEYLMGELGEIYPVFFEMDPRKSMYRINRDARFSKNKAPYKTNLGSHFVPGGKNSGNAGFYVHAEPGNCFLAVGIYGPEPAHLKKIREYLLTHHQGLEKILKSKNLTENFVEGFRDSKLKKGPRGFDHDHPAIELLKQKHFIIIHNFTDKEFLSKDFPKEVSRRFKLLGHVVKYLNTALISEN